MSRGHIGQGSVLTETMIVSVPAESLRPLRCFDGWSQEDLDRVGRKAVEIHLGKGEVVFLEGEPCGGLYVVKSGRVRVYMSSPEGREQVLWIALGGDSFNDVPVFDGGPNPASASALEPSVLYLVPGDAVVSLVAGCPAALAMLRHMGSRLRHLTGMVETLSFRTVVSRLARLLADMAAAEKGGSPVPRLTQDEMAAMVGSVRDVIGRGLKHLERAGGIRIEGHRILVVSIDRLRQLA